MAQSEAELLKALEHLMEEFFNGSTTNARKHEIQTQLNSFSSQRESWKPCIYFVANSTSQYVSMYSLSTIESVINRQWVSLEWEHRVQLKGALYTFFVEQDNSVPNAIRNKLAKLLVDIARFDWPHFYPDFFNNILQLLQGDGGRQLLGLILLRTASEELMSPRPDLSSYRKEELTRLFQQRIPQVFQILTSVLCNLSSKPRHSATATPPPSPTQQSVASTATPELVARRLAAAASCDDTDGKRRARAALATLQHLFTWAPLPQVDGVLVTAVFEYTNISSYAQEDDDMCVLAMSTLNELLYRKCTPAGSQNLFKQLYHHTVQLLRDISCPSTGKLDTIGQDFMEKLSELLSLLVEQHLWRLECESGFSALDLLALLYQLTMRLPSAQCYMHCLGVWAAFIKQIKPENAMKYSEALLGLVSAVLNKLQFSCNFAQLDETNNVDVDDNNETEWQIFLNTSVEIVAMIAEYAPLETLNNVAVPWRVANDLYQLIHRRLVGDNNNGAARHLDLAPAERHRVHCALRDLTSLTQTAARLAAVLINVSETDQNRYQMEIAPVLDSLVEQLLHSAALATDFRWYTLTQDDVFREDFTEVHVHLLAAMKTFALHRFSTTPTSTNDQQQYYIHLLSVLALPVLSTPNQQQQGVGNNVFVVTFPPRVELAAAHLLRTLCGTALQPAQVIGSVPPMGEYIRALVQQRGGSGSTHGRSDLVMCGVVESAVAAALIRPWWVGSSGDGTSMFRGSDVPPETIRQPLQQLFFDGLTLEFRQIDVSHGNAAMLEVRVRDIVARTLPSLSEVVSYCSAYPTSSKKLLHCGLKNTIDQTLVVFPVYSRNSEISDKILSFFLTVLSVLQQQIGIETTTRAVQVFLDVAISEHQSKTVSSLDKLLQILQIVVEAPGSSYKNFLPSILQLCMQNVYPLVINQANENPDVIVALLSLLHSILLHRWSYFYTSQVRLGHSPGCSDLPEPPQSNTSSGDASANQPHQMVAVLQVFGQSLLQPDINAFRASLVALEHLNAKWKLYSKTLFKDQLLSQFLTVLMHSVLNKTHNLLMDDIFQAVYNMASVDFGDFFSTFLINFIQSMDGLAQTQRDSLLQAFTKETDMPTFVLNLQRFTNDMRCYKLCNSSLPPGSVVL